MCRNLRPKLHFAHWGFVALETLIYVSIQDSAYGLLQGIISTVWVVVSVVRDICIFATTQPGFINILYMWNTISAPQQQTAPLFTCNGRSTLSVQSCKGLCSESSEQPNVCNTPFAGYFSAQGIVDVWKKSLNTSGVSLNGIFVLMKLQHVEVRLL